MPLLRLVKYSKLKPGVSFARVTDYHVLTKERFGRNSYGP